MGRNCDAVCSISVISGIGGFEQEQTGIIQMTLPEDWKNMKKEGIILGCTKSEILKMESIKYFQFMIRQELI